MRRRYIFEDLGEGPFVAAIIVLPPITALVVACGALAAGWDRDERRSRVAGLATLPFSLMGTVLLASPFFD